MFSISIISPSASQTLIDSTLLLPVAGPCNLPHFLETERCVRQANWFNQVKWFAQGHTRSWCQERSVFWRSASTQLCFGCGRVGAAMAQPWECGPCSCSLQINPVGLCCLAHEAGNRNKLHRHTLVVKPAQLAVHCLFSLNWKQLGLVFGFSFPSFFLFLQITWNLNCSSED